MSTHKRRVRVAAHLYENRAANRPEAGITIDECAKVLHLRPRHVAKEIARRKGEPWAPHAGHARTFRVPPARCDKRTLARIARERHEAERSAFLADLAKNGPPTFLTRR